MISTLVGQIVNKKDGQLPALLKKVFSSMMISLLWFILFGYFYLINIDGKRLLLKTNLNDKMDEPQVLHLLMKDCDATDIYQQWTYNTSHNLQLIRASAFGNSSCIISTGNSNPIMTAYCDDTNPHQLWNYVGHEIQSTDTSCLDIFGENGTVVDEWPCKPVGDPDGKNQQWMVSGTQIKSVLDAQCLATAPTTIKFDN
eukprot:144977_1